MLLNVADTFVANGLAGSRDRYLNLVDSVYRHVDLKGARVLDIGCGVGTLAFAAAALGAETVIGLEPEMDGSTEGVVKTGMRLSEDLKMNNVDLRECALEDFSFEEGPFDVIVMYNVINHLDENACIHLQEDPAAREKYRVLLTDLFERIRPGGTLIVADCARHNLFADLNVKNPMAPTIEWEEHQDPTVWVELLSECGFHKGQIWWNPLYRLRVLGPLIRNKVGAYLTNSHFVFQVERPS